PSHAEIPSDSLSEYSVASSGDQQIRFWNGTSNVSCSPLSRSHTRKFEPPLSTATREPAPTARSKKGVESIAGPVLIAPSGPITVSEDGSSSTWTRVPSPLYPSPSTTPSTASRSSSRRPLRGSHSPVGVLAVVLAR